jgi:hypothetical protein
MSSPGGPPAPPTGVYIWMMFEVLWKITTHVKPCTSYREMRATFSSLNLFALLLCGLIVRLCVCTRGVWELAVQHWAKFCVWEKEDTEGANTSLARLLAGARVRDCSLSHPPTDFENPSNASWCLQFGRQSLNLRHDWMMFEVLSRGLPQVSHCWFMFLFVLLELHTYRSVCGTHTHTQTLGVS